MHLEMVEMKKRGAKPKTWNSPDEFIEWLMLNVIVCPNGCWIWTGADSGGEGRGAGYSKVRYNNKTVYVHRLVYSRLVGAIPPRHQIDHKCRHWNREVDPVLNRRCVNPHHLEAVTQSDNIKRNHYGA